MRFRMNIGVGILISMIAFGVQAQTQPSAEDSFAVVPEHLRASLRESLLRFVEFESSENWAGQYEMTFESIDGTSKDEYLTNRQKWQGFEWASKLLDFTPSGVVALEVSPADGWWAIEGCSRFRTDGRIERLKSEVEVHRIKGNWYFSSIGAITGIDGPAIPCSIPDL